MRANAEAEAIVTVFDAIHEGRPNADLLAYQYLQVLPQIADSESSKLWIIPSEVTDALNRFSSIQGAQPDTSESNEASQGPTPPPTPRRRTKRATTAAEIADRAPKAPKLEDTSLEEALAEPEIEEETFPHRPRRHDDGEQK